jgi:hypothetical protein
MKSYIRCLFLAPLSAAVVIGCKTTPEAALTLAILERVKKIPGYELQKIKFLTLLF